MNEQKQLELILPSPLSSMIFIEQRLRAPTQYIWPYTPENQIVDVDGLHRIFNYGDIRIPLDHFDDILNRTVRSMFKDMYEEWKSDTSIRYYLDQLIPQNIDPIKGSIFSAIDMLLESSPAGLIIGYGDPCSSATNYNIFDLIESEFMGRYNVLRKDTCGTRLIFTLKGKET